MTVNPRKQIILYLTLLALLATLAVSCRQQALPPQDVGAAWTFAVISDTQADRSGKDGKSCINDAVVGAIADDIALTRPDLVLVTGDLVNGWFRNHHTDYDAQYENWKKAMMPVYRAGIKVYAVRGNHDSGPERLALPPLPAHLEPPADTVARLKETFEKYFARTHIPVNGPDGEKGLTYSFVHKNAFFIGLDQYAGGQHKVSLSWLDRQLAGNRSPHVFIYGHEPAFETGHPDNLGFFPKERDAFWNAIGRAGGKIYFCGHDHFYNRALAPDGSGRAIRQIIAGTGGGALRKWTRRYRDPGVREEFHNGDYHGYLLVSVEGSQATIIWKALVKQGQTNIWRNFDTFTYAVP